MTSEAFAIHLDTALNHAYRQGYFKAGIDAMAVINKSALSEEDKTKLVVAIGKMDPGRHDDTAADK